MPLFKAGVQADSVFSERDFVDGEGFQNGFQVRDGFLGKWSVYAQHIDTVNWWSLLVGKENICSHISLALNRAEGILAEA